MKSKIINELPDLVKQNVISSEVANKIENYYIKKTEVPSNRLFVIFGVLGSALIGLGIILMVAHNWDDLSKTSKTILAFLPMLIGQIFVGFSILKNKTSVWKESSGTFLFFAVGACIALVSQIYNIPGDLSGFLLTWIVLGLPLIYLLKSKSILLLSIVFATYYAVQSDYSYDGARYSPWLYLAMLASILPFYFRLLALNATSNIVSILNWVIPISLTIALGTFIEDNWVFGFLIYMMLFGALYNIGKLPIYNSQQLRRNGYLIIGSLGSVILLMILSFKSLWENFSKVNLDYTSPEIYVSIVLFFFAVLFLSIAFKNRKKEDLNLFQFIFLLFIALFFIGIHQDLVGAVLINIGVFILGLSAIKIGADKFNFGILNYGLLIITILIVCRFFDTNMSFVFRGLMFVAVGISFFLTNYYMLKKQKRNANTILK